MDLGRGSATLYRRGSAGTSLADIAHAADVPVGNVYCYFETEDDIVGAVVQAHPQQLESTLAALERRHRSVRTRLEGLMAVLAERADESSRYGRPYGTPSAELG